MKLSKLLKQLNSLIDTHEREREKQRKELKAALKKLRKKQHDLDKALQHCHDAEEQRQLEEKIQILATQRRKGLERLKDSEERRTS